MKQYEVIGVIITLLGAVLWGVSGASVQFLSNFRDMNLEWLVNYAIDYSRFTNCYLCMV